MKQLLFSLALLVTISSCGQGSQQRKSPHDTVTYANGSVTYGRPYKHDRDIFGALVEYGKVWRLGADEATIITFNTDTKFGDVMVPKGSYTLFALVNEKEWTFILNTQLGQWGAFSYEKYKDKDIAKVTVPVDKLDKVVEQLTIQFNAHNTMIVQWDTVQVTVPLSF